MREENLTIFYKYIVQIAMVMINCYRISPARNNNSSKGLLHF